MPSSNICWGIELGAGSIKALKLQRDGDELRVLEFAVIPHAKVLSTPDLDQVEATRVAVGKLVSQFDLSGASIAIGVPGHSGFARFAKLPPVEPKKIPDIVKFEAVQQIPFNIDEVEWDYQTFTSADSPDVEVGIFAVTRDRIMERLAMWNDVGVTPDFVTLCPIAAYNALAWDMQFDSKTPGTVILDVGTSSTDLIVCEPGRLWVRTFPIGGHQFTQALVDAFKLSYSKAEALKLQAEQSKHARHIFQAMRPIFGDLAQDVQRSIGYYQSSHKDANLTRLVGLGSTFNLPGLRKYLGQQLQMEVVRLEQFNRLTVDGPASGEFQAATPNMATAYGLALQGLGFEHGVMVNLMPVPVVREALWKRKTKWFAVAAGLSLAAGGLTFIRPVTARPLVEKSKPQEVVDTARMIQNLKSEWQTALSEFKPDFRAATSAALIEHRDVVPHLLNDLGLLLADADSKKGDKPGFRFDDYRTTYLPPAVDPNNPVAPGATDAAGVPQGTGRVRVTLTIETTRSEAEAFLVSSVLKWLDANSDRAGVPYVYDKKTIRYDRTISQVPQPGDAAGGGGGAMPPPTAEPSPGGGKSRQFPGMPEGDPRGGRQFPPMGESPFPPPGTGYPGSTPGAADVDKYAPLPKPPPIGEPGSNIYKFTVTFEAALRGEKPPEAQS